MAKKTILLRSGWGSKNPASGLAVLILFSRLVCSTTQGTLEPRLITFEGPPLQPPGTQHSVSEYYEAGMAFTPIHSSAPSRFTRNGGGFDFYPENGSAYLQALDGDSLKFSFLDGFLFDLLSVDLAEYSTVVPDAVTVQFVGYRWHGGTVSTSFTTDGIIDGTGPLADFETFHFGP
ncbi:MAG: hypothetical protein KIS67_24420, partial [Verrucomicrobiae bacterium]|nr:hypothetical protein [Verrucomicrobiae bacterium]